MKNTIEVKKGVLEVFNAIAESYSYTRRKCVVDIPQITDVKRCRFILDMGCGPCQCGELVFKYSDTGGKFLVCADIALNMLTVSMKRLKKRGLFQYVDMVNCDLEFIPFRSNSFDCIVLIAVLHHLPTANTRVNALKEIHRIATSRSTIVVSVWHVFQPKHLYRVFLNIFKKLIGRHRASLKDIYVPWHSKKYGVLKRFYHVYTLRELVKECINADFRIIKKFIHRVKSRFFIDNAVVVLAK